MVSRRRIALIAGTSGGSARIHETRFQEARFQTATQPAKERADGDARERIPTAVHAAALDNATNGARLTDARCFRRRSWLAFHRVPTRGILRSDYNSPRDPTLYARGVKPCAH